MNKNNLDNINTPNVASDNDTNPSIFDVKSTESFRIILTLALLALVFTSSGLIAYNKKRIKQISQNLQQRIENQASKNTNGRETREKDGCKIEGCNSELCVDPDVTYDLYSACIYRPEYECYNYSICEKQENGTCG